MAGEPWSAVRQTGGFAGILRAGAGLMAGCWRVAMRTGRLANMGFESRMRRFRNVLFWRNSFDKAWDHNSIFMKLPDIGWRWGRRIEEKRSFWREHGKRQQLSPSQAVFRGFEDIANTIYEEHDDKEQMQSTWLELANAQCYAAHLADWNGPRVPVEQRLSERWQTYYAVYRAKYDADIEDKKRRASEVQSHRFDRKEIDEAWQRLLAGEVSRDVQAIWLHAEQRRPAHQIASRAKVTIRDFVFWMVVLRDHGFMREEVVMDEHLYCNQRSRQENRENRDHATKTLLDKLAGEPVKYSA